MFIFIYFLLILVFSDNLGLTTEFLIFFCSGMQSETPLRLRWRWIYEGFAVMVIAQKVFFALKLLVLKSTGPETMLNRRGLKNPV